MSTYWIVEKWLLQELKSYITSNMDGSKDETTQNIRCKNIQDQKERFLKDKERNLKESYKNLTT